MDKLQITLNGYKCFRETNTFNLNKITLFTGANSAGKSSVVQSILIAKVLSEATVDKPFDIITPLNLRNDRYALDLGGYSDIINRETTTGDIDFSLGGIQYSVRGEDNEDDHPWVNFRISNEDRANLRAFFDKGFVYLSADRMAPHFEYAESDFSDFCDCHGSNVGDVFNSFKDENADPCRSLNFEGNFKVLMQLDQWCDYIFPGVAIRVNKTGSRMYQIVVRSDVSPNVGFGITHALPILLSGLLAPKGGMFVVENPEAHLHAKAQSNLGYFLARMAMAGVRVIIETHSEHIVNGIRRLIVEQIPAFKNNDVTIYFLKNIAGKRITREITVDSFGNLSEFPVDFFDQVRQDMLYLMETGRKRS